MAKFTEEFTVKEVDGSLVFFPEPEGAYLLISAGTVENLRLAWEAGKDGD